VRLQGSLTVTRVLALERPPSRLRHPSGAVGSAESKSVSAGLPTGDSDNEQKTSVRNAYPRDLILQRTPCQSCHCSKPGPLGPPLPQ
jgi:hypothetical protein